jgi:hypothetical protein
VHYTGTVDHAAGLVCITRGLSIIQQAWCALHMDCRSYIRPGAHYTGTVDHAAGLACVYGDYRASNVRDVHTQILLSAKRLWSAQLLYNINQAWSGLHSDYSIQYV